MFSTSIDLAELYRRYAPAVHPRAPSPLREREEALDVTQNVFLGYFELRETLRGEASAFTVLYRIATYQSIDRLRHRGRWSADDDAAADDVAAYRGEAAGIEAAMDLALLTRG